MSLYHTIPVEKASGNCTRRHWLVPVYGTHGWIRWVTSIVTSTMLQLQQGSGAYSRKTAHSVIV